MKSLRLAALACLVVVGFAAQADEIVEPPGDFDPATYGKVAVLHWSQTSRTPVGPEVTAAVAEKHKARNRADLAALIREARAHGAEWVVTPEMAVAGYPGRDYLSRDELAPYVETVPGATTKYFSALAKELGIYLHVGFPEVVPSTGEYFNSVAAFGPDGALVALHHKVNLYEGETDYVSAGDRATIYSGPFGKMGIGICADIYSELVIDSFREAGAVAIGLSSSWAVADPMAYFEQGAIDTGAYLLAANTTYFPDAGVINPDGTDQSHIRETIGVAYGYLKRARR